MEPREESVAENVRTIAAIDIGSNAVRLVIASVLPSGEIEVLEHLQRAVRLGQDTFRRGRLGGQSMRSAVKVLRDFRKTLDLYHVERIHAVATNAVREASNSDIFLNRVFMATGLQVQVIAASEESRLTVAAALETIGDTIDVNAGTLLFAEVGGGSTNLTVLQEGKIITSHSLRLGSIRLQEMLSTSDESPERSAGLLRQEIINELKSAESSLSLRDVTTFVAIGGDARFAARQITNEPGDAHVCTVESSVFSDFVQQCLRYSPVKLAREYRLPFEEAETLNPALLIYDRLLRSTSADRLIISNVSMRDGLLIEAARDAQGQGDDAMRAGVIRSAIAIATKFRTNMNHARTVADFSVWLFDQMQSDHGLGSRQRLLLRVAGLLHEVGGVISSRSHHKHSYYLIRHSEIFGLSDDEIELVAHVARYHRRAVPRPSHLDYVSLPRENRMVVNQLAALLRVADALARGTLEKTSDMQAERSGDDLIICVPSGLDLLLERHSIVTKGDLFEDVFGMRIRLEDSL